MKTKLHIHTMQSLIGLLLCSQLAFAQFNPQKAEIYQTGTKLIYYLGQCGEDIPETQGKLTFCDKKGSLGVVETSFGLNSNKIRSMADNYYNNDEVFVTTAGISQRKEDGTWQNYPNLALARDLSNNPNTSVSRALLDTQGRMYYNGSNNYALNWVDINTFEKGSISLSSQNLARPEKFAFDPDTGTLYFSVIVTNQGAHGLLLKHSISEELLPIPAPTGSSRIYKLVYNNNTLYVLSNAGVHRYDAANNQMVEIIPDEDLTTNPNYIQDMVFENDQNVWVSVTSNNYEGRKLYLIDVETNTIVHDMHIPTVSGTANINPQYMTFDVNGQLWVTTVSFSGIVSINPADYTITYYTQDDLRNLGFGLTYAPDAVHTQNNKTYLFCGSNSTTLNQHEEAIVYDGTHWTGRSDDEPGNISTAFTRRFHQSEAADDGVWWSNGNDNGVHSFIGYDDNLKVSYNQNIPLHGRQFVIDTDNHPVYYGGSPQKLYKLYHPQNIDIHYENSFSFNDVLRYKDQIWTWSHNSKKIKIFKDNSLIGEYDLSELPNGLYDIGADAAGRAYFSKYNGNTQIIELYQYDFTTEQLNAFTHEPGGSTTGVSAFVPLPDGGILILFGRRLVYFKDGNFIDFTPNDQTFYSDMRDAVADTEGNLYIVKIDASTLIKMTDFPNNHEGEFIELDGSLGNINAISPDIHFYRPSSVTLDHEGKFWAHASGNFMRLTMDDSPTAYNLYDGETFGVKGRVFLDINENDLFDAGEEFGNQRVALVVNGEEKVTTYTNANGEYYFNYYQLGVPYDIVLPALAPNTTTDIRFQTIEPTQNTEDSWVEDFMLKPIIINGLLVKDSNKNGAFALQRTGFENVFTTAIGNVTYSRTYNNVALKYTFKAETDNPDFELPEILETKLFRITPLNNTCPIFNMTINPNNNNWALQRLILGIDYTLEEVGYEITENHLGDEIHLEFTIPQISPLEVYVVQIETEIFDPVFNGTAIGYGFSRASGPDLGGEQGNPVPREFVLMPREDDNPFLGSPVEFNPYIHPDDINEEVPFTEPKDFYIPPPRNTVVRSSWDPNDKLISPGLEDVLNEQDINKKWLLYTIRFENEGNFSAKDVSVLDELDEKLDLHTLTLVEASHPVQLHQITTTDKVFMKFDFNDIYLDYTDNDPEASQGWISFYIKAKDDVQVGDIVENTASIYFDQNPPIVTNTVQTQFVESTMGIEEIQALTDIVIYPNPVSNILNIFTEQQIKTLTLYDILGNKVLSAVGSKQLDVSQYAKGLYILKIETDGGQTTKKIVVE